MSKREYRRFTAEQKLEILREAERPGVTVSEVCRRHGLAPSALGAVSLAGGGPGRLDRGAEAALGVPRSVYYAWKRLIDIKTRPRHPESNGIVERFNGTVREETDDDYGNNYRQAEAIIARLMQHYNEERLHAALGYVPPAIWHRGQPNEIRDERARRSAAARTHRKAINQQRFPSVPM